MFGLLYLLPHPLILSANHWKPVEELDMDILGGKEVELLVVKLVEKEEKVEGWYWDIRLTTLRLEKLLTCFRLIVPTLDGVSSDTGTWKD